MFPIVLIRTSIQILVCLMFITLVAGPARAHHDLPKGFVLEEVTSGLVRPTAMAFAPDGRIFIAEKGGTIRIIEKGKLLQEPFYTVVTETPNERGLDGIALDPDFDKNHYVYLYYSIKDDRRNKLARVTAAGNTALPDSELELMKFGKMWGSWHNGGALLFGHDKKLYVSIGDGTAGVNAPKMDWLLGKILRLNTDGSIPADNPFYNDLEGDFRAIYAYGIRNPYTMGISNSSGRIFFCDVGNELYEEVNELFPGTNYGWNRVEGHLPAGTPAPDAAYVDPLYAYDHAEEKCAIVGAAFYEPDELRFPAEYHGKFFFMDYCTGVIYYLHPDTHEVKVFASGFDFPNNLSVGDDGSLYVMKLKTGELFRISYVGSGEPFISRQPKTSKSIPGETVTVQVEASGDAPLNYQWSKNGQMVQEGENNLLQLENVVLSDSGSVVFCLVSNQLDTISSDTVTLEIVNGTRPVIEIQEPEWGSKFSAGDTISYRAEVYDEEGALDSMQVTWQVDFHHDEHSHPAQDPLNLTEGHYAIGKSGEVDTNVFYRFMVEAVDEDGLTSTDYVDIHPSIIQMSIVSEPAGIEVSIDGAANNTNYTLHSLANQTRTLECPIYDIVENHFFAFTSWENGDTSRLRIVDAEDQLELGLTYADSGFYYQGNNSALRLKVYEGTGDDTLFYKEQRQHSVNQNWDVQSPYRWDGVFPDDGYSVLYTGFLIPPISATYTLHFLHDGFITVRLGDSIILDRVEDDSELTESDDVTMFLEGGRKYDFSMFYEHIRYVARVQASWSYSVVKRQVIPEEQFEKYDPSSTAVDTNDTRFTEPQLTIFPNPIGNGMINFKLESNQLIEKLQISIYNEVGQEVINQDVTLSNQHGSLAIPQLAQGIYFLEFKVADKEIVQRFIVAR